MERSLHWARTKNQNSEYFSCQNSNVWLQMMSYYKTDEKRPNSFDILCYRRILRIIWRERKSNEWVLQKIGKATLMNSINKQKLSFISHMARSHGIRNDILSGIIYGTQQRGQPRRKLENDIKDIVGMSIAGLLWNAQDRENWRNTIVAATAGQERPFHC